MSEVYSFRLSDQNLREAQAKGVLEAWVKQGYSLRYILTEALLLFGKNESHNSQMDEMAETIDRLTCLVDRLEGNFVSLQPTQTPNADLTTSFISSIRDAIKPGIILDREK